MATVAHTAGEPRSYSGIWSWITTVDHKQIGTLYLFTALIFFFIAGTEILIVRSQLARPDHGLISADLYNQLMTMHGISMIFLGVMPLSVAFFNWIVPLQIGARDVAFPRLNALSYWVFLFGGILLNLGWFTGGAADAGWFAYANLTSITYSPGDGVTFFALGLLVLGVSSLAGALNFTVTIINMRAPGMSLMRLPLFTWMAFVTGVLLVFAMPVITIGLVEIFFDRYLGANFFNVAAGGDVILWQHVFWVFGHPEVYILILPAMGIVSEILPTFARKPLYGYSFVVFSGIVIGFMGWTVWSHHMFSTGMGAVADSAFTITTMLIAVPTGVKIFNWIATLWGGSISFKTPMYFALGFIALFIIGGLSGVSHASPPSDLQQQDTYYIVAHFHYVLFGGAIFGIFAGIYYWYPKLLGRHLKEGLGKLHFWFMFIGMNLTFGPMHWVGMDGMPRRVYTYPTEMGWDFWNLVATVGAFIMAISFLFFIYNVIVTARSKEKALGDPWDARTIEWSIPSPVPHYNFAEIPTIKGRDDWWITKYGSEEHPANVSAVSDPGNEDEGDHHDIHMPDPSYFPLVSALGLALTMGGLVFPPFLQMFGLDIPIISVVGGIILLIGTYGWAFEPVNG